MCYLMVLKVSSFNQWYHYQLGSWWKCKHSGPTPDPLNQNLYVHNPPRPQLIHVMLTWYIWCTWYSEQHYPIELFMILESQAVAWCCPCCHLTRFWARSLFATSVLPKFVPGSFLLHVTSSPLTIFFFNWWIIVLQNSVVFCQTSTWIPADFFTCHWLTHFCPWPMFLLLHVIPVQKFLAQQLQVSSFGIG